MDFKYGYSFNYLWEPLVAHTAYTATHYNTHYEASNYQLKPKREDFTDANFWPFFTPFLTTFGAYHNRGDFERSIADETVSVRIVCRIDGKRSMRVPLSDLEKQIKKSRMIF